MLPPKHRAFMRANLTDTLAMFFVGSIILGIMLFKSELFAVDIIEIMIGVVIGGCIAYISLPMKIQPNPDLPDSVLDQFDNRPIKREIIFILIVMVVVLSGLFLYLLYQGKWRTVFLMPNVLIYPLICGFITEDVCWIWVHIRISRLKARLSSSTDHKD